MPSKKYKYLFIVGALIFGLLVIVTANMTARITVANESLVFAFSQCMHYLIVQPVGTLFLLFPFVLVGCGAVVFCNIKDENIKRGWCLSVCCLLPISVRYFIGYHDAQTAMQKGASTAAALSEGLLPFISLPIIGIGAFVCIVASAMLESRKTRN